MQDLDLKTMPVLYLYSLFNSHGNCHRFLIFHQFSCTKCMDHDVVMTKGISFMYMMSASSVTLLCHCIISVGSLCIVVTTQDEFFHTILPCTDPMFTPKMSSAHSMSALVTGQFGIIYDSIYLINSCVFGLPIIFEKTRCLQHQNTP